MFKSFFAVVLCVVFASVSQIAADRDPSGAYISSGKTCSQAWLPPLPRSHDRGINCIGGGNWYVCQRSGVAQEYGRKAPNGKVCTSNGASIKDQVCIGGFQSFNGFVECFPDADRSRTVRCKSVEAMFAAGGDCDK